MPPTRHPELPVSPTSSGSPTFAVPPPPLSSASSASYPQLWRGLGLPWWRPWLALLLLVLLFGLFYAALATVLAFWPLPPQPPLWQLLLVLLAPLVALIPACRLAVHWGLACAAGWLDSQQRHFRWQWCALATGISMLALLPFLALEMRWLQTQPLAPEADWVWLALLLPLLIPLQAAGEEYLFRGFLTQFIGQWCRSRQLAFWLPLLFTATLFALAHGEQNMVLFATRFGLGALFFWLTWRTGGLEAAVALHAASNLLSFAQSVATGTTLASLFGTEAGWQIGAGQLAASALAAWLLVQTHQHRIRTDDADANR